MAPPNLYGPRDGGSAGGELSPRAEAPEAPDLVLLVAGTPRSTRPGAATSRRGFTLLEVMVALAILAGSLLAVSEVVSGALRNHVRARELEVATLLARGKVAELEDRFEAKGFGADRESEDGTFEEEGHPEIRWQLEVAVPPADLEPEALVRLLTGSEGGLAALFPPPDQAPQLAPFAAQLAASVQTLLPRLAEQVKRGVREVRLTVSWPSAGRDESFTVRTCMVVLQGTEGVQ